MSAVFLNWFPFFFFEREVVPLSLELTGWALLGGEFQDLTVSTSHVGVTELCSCV